MVWALLGVVILIVIGGKFPRRFRWPFPHATFRGLHLDPGPVTGGEPGARQSRPQGVRVAVPFKSIHFDDGDTVRITWPGGDREEVRMLGVDAPEVAHPSHGRKFGQKEGPAATEFTKSTFRRASQIELLRAANLDLYGRSLGYFFLDGINFSTQMVEAKQAYETITSMGDNGFPVEAAAVREAAKRVGQPSFEAPHLFRRRTKNLKSLP